MHHFVKPYRSAFCLSIFILFIVVMGCVSAPHRVHPEFEDRVQKIEKPVLMPPDVKIFELSSAGVSFYRDDWSSAGRKNIQRAVLKSFDDSRLRAKPLVADPEMVPELEEIRSLFKLVNKSIRENSYGRSRRRPAKAQDFDYSVGSLQEILQKLDADAMIFASGLSQISKNESKTVVNLAVADPTGKIIWFSVKGGRDRSDLRDPETTAQMVQELLSTFHGVGG